MDKRDGAAVSGAAETALLLARVGEQCCDLGGVLVEAVEPHKRRTATAPVSIVVENAFQPRAFIAVSESATR